MSAAAQGPTAGGGSLALRRAKDIWQLRADAPTSGDTAYRVYVVVLGFAVLVIPAAIAFRHVGEVALGGIGVTEALTGATLAAVLLIGAAAAVAGAQRGPALTSPFFAETLASGPFPRRRALLGRYLQSVALLAAAGAACGALLGGALLSSGGGGVPEAVALGLDGLAAGALIGVLWLAGEVLEATPRRVLMGALAGLAVVVVAVPGLAPLVGGVLLAPLGAEAAAAIAIVLAGVGVMALDRIRGEVLLGQSIAWEGAVASTMTGDSSNGAAALRALPSIGRGLPVIAAVGGPAWWRLGVLYAVRDLVAMIRTPERAVIGVVGSAGGGAALAVAASGLIERDPASSPLLLVGLGLLGTGALWGATSALSDGMRHGLATAGAPALFGQTPARAALLHAPAPLLLTVALTAIGVAGAVLGGAAGAASGVTVLVVAVLLVGVRLRECAKGPMPLALLTPVPTAMGDMSAMRVLGWQLDAPRLAAITAAVVVGGAMLGPVPMLVGTAVMALVVGYGTRSRIRELSDGDRL